MKKKLLFLLFIFIFIITPKNTYAETNLKIKSIIPNIRNSINSTITYEIIPHAENPDKIDNDINSYTVDFTDTEVIDNTITNESYIDFSNINYTIPGTYRYGIRQKSTNDKNIVLTNKTYEIYIEVTKDIDDNINIDVKQLIFDFASLEKKELEYTNEVNYYYLSIKQKVDGEYKNHDLNTYFKYKITFNGKVGDQYTISGQDSIVYYDGENIETEENYIVKEDNNYMYIYLKDNQEITIGRNGLDFNEIPEDIEYTITKIDASKWSTTINGKEIDTLTSKINNKKNEIIIINTRDYDDAVTGLLYNVLPFILIIILIVGSYIIYKKIKYKKM